MFSNNNNNKEDELANILNALLQNEIDLMAIFGSNTESDLENNFFNENQPVTAVSQLQQKAQDDYIDFTAHTESNELNETNANDFLNENQLITTIIQAQPQTQNNYIDLTKYTDNTVNASSNDFLNENQSLASAVHPQLQINYIDLEQNKSPVDNNILRVQVLSSGGLETLNNLQALFASKQNQQPSALAPTLFFNQSNQVSNNNMPADIATAEPVNEFQVMMEQAFKLKVKFSDTDYSWQTVDSKPLQAHPCHKVIIKNFSLLDSCIESQWRFNPNVQTRDVSSLTKLAWSACKGEGIRVATEDYNLIDLGRISDFNLLTNFVLILKMRSQKYSELFFDKNLRLHVLINQLNKNNFVKLINAVLKSTSGNNRASTFVQEFIARIGNVQAIELVLKVLPSTKKGQLFYHLLNDRLTKIQQYPHLDNLLDKDHPSVSIKYKTVAKLQFASSDVLTTDPDWPVGVRLIIKENSSQPPIKKVCRRKN